MFIFVNASKRQTDLQLPPAAKLTDAASRDRVYGYDQLLLELLRWRALSFGGILTRISKMEILAQRLYFRSA